MTNFMQNMLNHTSDGSSEGALGVIPPGWSSETTTTEKWLYILAGNPSPGSYEVIDGYNLATEGSAQLGDGENPELAALQLVDCFVDTQPDVRVAIVTKILDKDGEEIYTEVTEVFGAES